ncbi:GCN5 family acetyltransferase [Gordoniibacillus kamchatkensis]|uniref:GCN5 family acetyltransferase n=1 Tax=Gordoniibacillus kamchatkensis TaxID=1590651 RepID=A0ABR5AM12_9BACL|nr:GNAT family N-acetyltransferase [Paenibacillus sp. VKM B-2647]KIL42039.1 GCN5 family acetyltransferase [Paenibacillus sp. VKM B-2647]
MDIVRLSKEDGKSLRALYKTVTADLEQAGVHQWDRWYPNRFVIGGDVKRGAAFGIRDGGRIVAAVVVDRRQSANYGGLPWSDGTGDPLCIHRLAVHPEYQGRGIGKKLLQFAEDRVRREGGTSIRLDVYTGNPGAVQLYRRAGYAEVGAIRFPMRPEPYLCFEKLLLPNRIPAE